MRMVQDANGGGMPGRVPHASGHPFEPLQLLHERRALKVQQSGCLALVAAGSLERSLNKPRLGPRDEAIEIKTLFREREGGREGRTVLTNHVRQQIWDLD